MRIFLDTNVILENFLVREDFKTAHNLFHAMQGQKHELYDNESLLRGIKNETFKDIEDGCQYELAMRSGCTLLLTFNSHDYPSDDIGNVKVMTPAEYLEQQENKNS